MMTDRPYRKALSLQAIKDELRSNAAQFAPYVVESFVELLNLNGNTLLKPYAGYNAAFSAG